MASLEASGNHRLTNLRFINGFMMGSMANLGTSLVLSLVARLKRGGVIICEHALTEAQTRLHLRVLSRRFNFIGLDDLPRHLGPWTRKPFCLLTFDDGKRSSFTDIAPVLESLGVPAVFYVPTDFLTTGSALWFDQRLLLIRALGYCPAGLELATLKQLPLDSILERLKRACAEHRFEPRETSDHVRPMSWEEVRSLHKRGFTIGAHGSTHAILTCESRARAYQEIEESLAKVSSEIGKPCTSFAFPNGNYDLDLVHYALRCGASTTMTTDPAWAGNLALLPRLPRIQLFGNDSPARMKLKIALAGIHGLMPNPNGAKHWYRYLRRTDAPLPSAVSQ